MKPVINWLAKECRHCIKCLKSCPVDAISIVNHKVEIDDTQCIYCGTCISGCPTRVLKTNTQTINTLDEHEFNVVLIPTSLLSDSSSYQDFTRICHAIKELGFDCVEHYSDIEGYLYRKALEDSKKEEGVWLTSFCPTINKLIETKYPTVYEQVLPYEYPVEIAAKRLREKYKDKDIGIYSLCECIGKLTLAKHPFDNANSNIDYAISIQSVFPKINKSKNQETLPIEIDHDGVISNVQQLYGHHEKTVITTAGLNQAHTVLDLIEFDSIKNIDLVGLFACYQGCIGGTYLWSNPFEGCYNIESVLPQCVDTNLELDEADYLLDREMTTYEMQSMKEKMAWFAKVNEVLEDLPHFDCGACGFANCRTLAQNVVNGKVTEQACRVKRR